jgi:hypothetical protein
MACSAQGRKTSVRSTTTSVADSGLLAHKLLHGFGLIRKSVFTGFPLLKHLLQIT